MKRLTLTLLISALPSMSFGAPAKESKAEASLVAALQAVSPDPLGSRLGLEVPASTALNQAQAARSPLAA